MDMYIDDRPVAYLVGVTMSRGEAKELLEQLTDSLEVPPFRDSALEQLICLLERVTT